LNSISGGIYQGVEYAAPKILQLLAWLRIIDEETSSKVSCHQSRSWLHLLNKQFTIMA